MKRKTAAEVRLVKALAHIKLTKGCKGCLCRYYLNGKPGIGVVAFELKKHTCELPKKSSQYCTQCGDESFKGIHTCGWDDHMRRKPRKPRTPRKRKLPRLSDRKTHVLRGRGSLSELVKLMELAEDLDIDLSIQKK